MYKTRRHNTIVLLIFPVLAVLIGVLVPWFLTLDWLPPDLGAPGWIGLAIVGGLAIYPWLSRIGRRIDFFEPIYFISLLFLLVFFLRPIQILYDYEARARFMPDDPALFQKVLLLGALGFICFYIGYGSKIGIRMGRKLPKFGRQWRHNRVVQMAVVYTLIGIIGYSFAVIRTGGFRLFLSTLRGRFFLEEEGNWVFASTRVLVQVATIILGTYYFKTKRLGAFFAVSLALSVGSGLLLGSRSQVLVPLLTLLVMFYYLRSLKPGRFLTSAMVVGLFAGIALLFIVTQVAVRVHLARGGDVGALSLISLVTENIGGRFLDEFGQFDWFVTVLDITPSELPFQYGKSFLEFFTRFVPRAIWPEKPLPISYRINMMLGGASSGHPSTILGELYLNFNVPGVVVGLVIFGVLLRAMYAYLQHNWGNPAVILLYAYTFASLHRFFTRSFAPKMFGFVLFVLPTVLALRLIEQLRGRHAGRI